MKIACIMEIKILVCVWFTNSFSASTQRYSTKRNKNSSKNVGYFELEKRQLKQKRENWNLQQHIVSKIIFFYFYINTWIITLQFFKLETCKKLFSVALRSINSKSSSGFQLHLWNSFTNINMHVVLIYENTFIYHQFDIQRIN